LKSQYENANNISARIRLHKDYSTNKQGWFPWIYETGIASVLKQNSNSTVEILELGCGEGSLWVENRERLPENIHVTVSDISEGMIRDIRRNLDSDTRFTYETFDCHKIPSKSKTYDIVIARAVASLNILVELALPFVKVGGVFIAMKSKDYSNELNESKNALKVLGGEVEKIDTHYLSNDEVRNNIVIRKIKSGNKKYPREYKDIKAKPL
jgi:SAM-dependent methyltransferase